MSDMMNRQRIVEVATEYFMKHGFSKVTTDDIANELGMSKKTLYKHFPTKEDILREAVQVQMHEWTIRTSFLNDPEIKVIEKLRRLMLLAAGQYSKMGRTFLEDIKRNAPHIWKEVNEWRNTYILTVFRKFFREGVQQGVFRTDIPDHLAVLIYATTIQQMLNPDRVTELPYSAGEICEAVMKIVYEGVLTGDGREELKLIRTDRDIAGTAYPA